MWGNGNDGVTTASQAGGTADQRPKNMATRSLQGLRADSSGRGAYSVLAAELCQVFLCAAVAARAEGLVDSTPHTMAIVDLLGNLNTRD